MVSKKNNKIGIIMSLVIVLINILTIVLSWVVFSENGSFYRLFFITYRWIFIIYLVSLLFFSIIFDSFAFDRRKITENFYSISLSNFISICIFYFLDTLAFRSFDSPLYALIAFVLIIIENITLCKVANYLSFLNYVPKKTIIFYKEDYDLVNIKKLTYFDIKYNVIQKIKKPVNADFDLDCDAVFLSGIESSIRDTIIKNCIDKGIEAFIFPTVEDVIIAGGKYVEELSLPMIKINLSSIDFYYRVFKRLFDIVVSLVALVLFSPFMLITSILIKMYDGGPVLYKQVRLTKNRKKFTIYKFRSMKVDAEKDGIARISSKNDNRITPIGKIIRAIRFDELPQLFNILFGDMSIVGPRPERPEIAEQYEQQYPSFGLRLQVKAGLTGYAQVYGKYNSEPLDKLKMDLFYINNRSFLYDIKLCFMTIKILFMKESTEAIDEGKITADK